MVYTERKLSCGSNQTVFIIFGWPEQKLLWKWLTSSDEIRLKRDFFKFIVNREISLMVYDVCNVATQLCFKNELKNQARTWNIQSLQSESNARQNCRKASSRSFFPMLCVVVFFPIHAHARIVCELTARSFFRSWRWQAEMFQS